LRAIEIIFTKLKRTIRKNLREFGYPPVKQEKATIIVLEQTKSLVYE